MLSAHGMHNASQKCEATPFQPMRASRAAILLRLAGSSCIAQRPQVPVPLNIASQHHA